MLRVLGRRRPVRLAGHAAMYGTAGLLAKAGSLLAVPYLTRQLGPSDYGLVDLASSLAGLLVLVVRFGGDIPTMRLSAGEDEEGKRRTFSAFVGATAVVSVAVAALLLPTASIISAGLWSSPASTGLAVATLALVPINSIQGALASVLRFVERPRMFAAVAAVDLLAQVGLAVAFVAAGLGPVGVLLGYALGGAIGLIVAGIASRGYLTMKLSPGRSWTILSDGLPFLPGVVSFYLADTIARMVAANAIGISAVGQLALAIRVASVVSLAAVAFSSAWGPYGLSLRPSDSTRQIYGRVNMTLVGGSGFAAVGLGALAPELGLVAGGEAFALAAQAIPALLLSSGLASLTYVLTTAAGISHRGRWVAFSSVLGAAVQIAAAVLLLPTIGVAGFSVASLVGRLVGLVILGRSVSDVAPIPKRGVVLLGVFCLAVLGLQLLNASPWPFAIRAVLAAAAAAATAGMLVQAAARLTGSAESTRGMT